MKLLKDFNRLQFLPRISANKLETNERPCTLFGRRKAVRKRRLASSDVKMTRTAMTQETCDAASKCLNRNNGDPDDRADKIQTLEGMAKVIGALAMRFC